MTEKDKLNFCRVEGCFNEKQDGLDICATHYQENATEFIGGLIKELDYNDEKNKE